jgi:hypothetical protein
MTEAEMRFAPARMLFIQPVEPRPVETMITTVISLKMITEYK